MVKALSGASQAASKAKKKASGSSEVGSVVSAMRRGPVPKASAASALAQGLLQIDEDAPQVASSSGHKKRADEQLSCGLCGCPPSHTRRWAENESSVGANGTNVDTPCGDKCMDCHTLFHDHFAAVITWDELCAANKAEGEWANRVQSAKESSEQLSNLMQIESADVEVEHVNQS